MIQKDGRGFRIDSSESFDATLSPHPNRRSTRQSRIAANAWKCAILISLLHCMYETTQFLFTRDKDLKVTEHSVSFLKDGHGDIEQKNFSALPDFRNPPLYKLERLYASTDDIFELIDEDMNHLYRSRKKFGYSPYPVRCHHKVLCGAREEMRRKQESISRALASVSNFETANRRLLIDLGGRKYNSSVGWFLQNYPMTFDHVHVFEADEKYSREYREPNMTFHNVIVSDVDGEAVTAEDGCHWIKTPDSSHERRKLLQVPVVNKPQRTVDFSRWIRKEVTPDDMVVVKMDIEGEEYSLIPKMIQDGSIRLISELFIETHNLRFNHHHCIGAEKTRKDSYALLKSLRDAGVYSHEWY